MIMGKRKTRDPSLVAIGARLKDAIRDAGKYQKDVADDAGIGLRTLAGYLAGGGDIPTSTLLRLAAALGIRPGDLMDRLASPTHQGEDSLLTASAEDAALRHAGGIAYRRAT